MASLENVLTAAVEKVRLAQITRDNANNAAADALSAYENAVAEAQAAHKEMVSFVSTTVPGIDAAPRRIV